MTSLPVLDHRAAEVYLFAFYNRQLRARLDALGKDPHEAPTLH